MNNVRMWNQFFAVCLWFIYFFFIHLLSLSGLLSFCVSFIWIFVNNIISHSILWYFLLVVVISCAQQARALELYSLGRWILLNVIFSSSVINSDSSIFLCLYSIEIWIRFSSKCILVFFCLHCHCDFVPFLCILLALLLWCFSFWHLDKEIRRRKKKTSNENQQELAYTTQYNSDTHSLVFARFSFSAMGFRITIIIICECFCIVLRLRAVQTLHFVCRYFMFYNSNANFLLLHHHHQHYSRCKFSNWNQTTAQKKTPTV